MLPSTVWWGITGLFPSKMRKFRYFNNFPKLQPMAFQSSTEAIEGEIAINTGRQDDLDRESEPKDKKMLPYCPLFPIIRAEQFQSTPSNFSPVEEVERYEYFQLDVT